MIHKQVSDTEPELSGGYSSLKRLQKKLTIRTHGLLCRCTVMCKINIRCHVRAIKFLTKHFPTRDVKFWSVGKSSVRDWSYRPNSNKSLITLKLSVSSRLTRTGFHFFCGFTFLLFIFSVFFVKMLI